MTGGIPTCKLRGGHGPGRRPASSRPSQAASSSEPTAKTSADFWVENSYLVTRTSHTTGVHNIRSGPIATGQYKENIFFKISLFTQKKRKYSADTSLQQRRQEKNMVIWLYSGKLKAVVASSGNSGKVEKRSIWLAGVCEE